MIPYPDPIPYRLRIGVTGHRRLGDPEAVQHAVEAVLARIAETLTWNARQPAGEAASPDTWRRRLDAALLHAAARVWRAVPRPATHVPVEQQTPLHWIVISPLAQGADRIVARAVLARPDSRLEVLTPFRLQEYRDDFGSRADATEFEALLTRDPSPTELQPAAAERPAAIRGEAVQLAAEARDAGYEQVGRRVVEACEILIAIWNGKPAEGRGGTAEIVRYAIENERPVLWIDANNPAAPVRLISGKPSSGAEPGPQEAMWLTAFPTAAEGLSPGFHRLAAYNRDAIFDPAEYRSIHERMAGHLRSAAGGHGGEQGLSEAALTPILDQLLPHFARADQLAIRYRDLYKQAAIGMHVLAALAVTVVVAQVLFFPHQLWLISFEILAMVLAVVLLRISRREAWHEKWLHDRHLAERLRTALFTTLLGPPDAASPSPGEVLPFYRGPDDWVVDAHEAILEQLSLVDTSSALASLKRYLVDGWIAEQAAFHRKNARRRHRIAHRAHRTGLVLFGLTLLMATLHLLGVGHGGADHALTAWALVGLLITFLAIVLPAWGAAVHAVNSLLEHERMAIRSERMAEVLEPIAQQAEDAADRDALHRAAQRAEQVMATENHEWMVSLSFRGLVLPT